VLFRSILTKKRMIYLPVFLILALATA